MVITPSHVAYLEGYPRGLPRTTICFVCNCVEKLQWLPLGLGSLSWIVRGLDFFFWLLFDNLFLSVFIFCFLTSGGLTFFGGPSSVSSLVVCFQILHLLDSLKLHRLPKWRIWKPHVILSTIPFKSDLVLFWVVFLFKRTSRIFPPHKAHSLFFLIGLPVILIWNNFLVNNFLYPFGCPQIWQ